jgi:hypothetical protein
MDVVILHEEFMTKQIKTFGANESKLALYGPNSKPVYTCANSSITRGITSEPITFEECFNKFPSVTKIAQNLGFLKGVCAGTSGSVSYNFTTWTGATTPSQSIEQFFRPLDVYLNDSPAECNEIQSNLGESWLGCLWGTPSAPFSCTCPDIGPNYANYLKLRLNVATFWNTPKNTPVQRAEFLDALKYGRKGNITVPGDFSLKIGQVVALNITGLSGFPYSSSPSLLNGLYYIVGIKHVVTNTGTHETALALTQIPSILSASGAGSTFNADYP